MFRMDGELTPESLAMPRSQIVLTDSMLRLFNGHGAICVRDKTVTGLQSLNFPPPRLPVTVSAGLSGSKFGHIDSRRCGQFL